MRHVGSEQTHVLYARLVGRASYIRDAANRFITIELSDGNAPSSG